ncbi:Asp-tRNA(Asn)/Glu-tRNA(Gln) amidotransferase subunit GatC [Patescibacteria group bacterium]|nr:Asp-tRNA(Asn)/Glu-tRNA(Gln) amidotransferase subunit GatC [Patescibacteria group bacterium]
MSLDIKQIEHLAKLARIKLTAEEKKKFSQDLSSILEYVEKLGMVKSATDSLSQESVKKESQELREDQVIGIETEELNNLHSQFPQKEDRFIKAKPIFNN